MCNIFRKKPKLKVYEVGFFGTRILYFKYLSQSFCTTMSFCQFSEHELGVLQGDPCFISKSVQNPLGSQR